MEKLIAFLIEDPFKFLIGAMTFGVFYVFKSYDKRIGSDLTEHSRRMNKINDETKDTASKIRDVKNDFVASSGTLAREVILLKDEIREIQRHIKIEIKGIASVYAGQKSMNEKLMDYSKKLDSLHENYGKVILLEQKINRLDNGHEDIIKSIYSIADKVGKIKGE